MGDDGAGTGSNDFRLGVDFGTSHTVAVLRWPDGRVRPLLFDGSPLLASAVFAAPDGRIVVGRTAVHAARAQPERFEPYPKRCVDDGTVLLGRADDAGGPVMVPVEELITAVLRRVAEEAGRTAGRPVPHTVLTYPAGWRRARRNVLLAAANAVFPDVTLVPEPVAAAHHFVAVHGGTVPNGSCVLVYDLGAGTFDASVVRNTGTGFAVLRTDGLADAGGLDVDAAMMAYVGATYAGRDAATWARLSQPAGAGDRRLSRAFWDDIRAGKEILSYSTSVLVHVPLFDTDVPFGREQVEQLARPILDRTVTVARATLRDAGVDPADLAGLYLVGGASRMPLVGTLLHQRLGVAPSTVEQPELAVAEGSLHAYPGPAAGRTGVPTADAAAEEGVAVVAAPGTVGGPVGAGGRRIRDVWSGTGRRTRWAAVASVFVMVLTLLAVPFLVDRGGGDPAAKEGGRGGTPVGLDASGGAATGSPAAAATPSPTPSSAIDPCLVGTWRESSNVVNFSWKGTDIRLRSSGAIRRFWPEGRGITDFGKRDVGTGRHEGRRYEVVNSGNLRFRLRTGNGEMFVQSTGASGTMIGRINGREDWRIPMSPAVGQTSYHCEGDLLNISSDRRQVELRRLSIDPEAQV
ncbi:Hsp70 family protein [Plantactinospora sp. B5E13]|uniref:Hsp70 family protein n=1 Tax=unclassified Plantactinospora TaxID=2631981 RepID=UPI00325C37E8